MRERKSSGGAGHGDFERAARDAEIPDARAEKSSRGVCPGNDGVEPDAHVAAQSPLKIPRAEEIQTAPGYNFTGMQMDHGNHQKLAKATKLPHRLVSPSGVPQDRATSVPLWQITSFQQLADSLSFSKKSTPLQSSKSSLFLQNTRGGVSPTQLRDIRGGVPLRDLFRCHEAHN